MINYWALTFILLGGVVAVLTMATALFCIIYKWSHSLKEKDK